MQRDLSSCDDAVGMGAATQTSYVYYDDDNNAIPPEAEASVLMSIGMTEKRSRMLEAEEVEGKGEGEGLASAGSADTPEDLVDYHEDAGRFEEERMEALKWLSAFDLSSKEAEGKQKAEPNHNAVEQSSLLNTNTADASTATTSYIDERLDTEEYDEEEGEGEEEEDGMGAPQFSREATASDEPWVLERILARRMFKQKLSESSDSGSSSQRQKEVQYLCKWKYYDEPTWEGRTLLEDEGFKGACDEYDGVTAGQPGGVQRGRRGNESDEGRYNHNLPIDLESPIEQILGKGADFTAQVDAVLGGSGIASLYYMSVAIPQRVNAFLAKWRSLSATHRPQILFHGTNSKNIISIVRNGLIVPGQQGVRVANGSVYGVGIYTATNPTTSSGYCNQRQGSPSGQGEMFACVGLVSNTDSNIKLACGGSYVIFFDASYIVPVGLVGYEFTQGTQPSGRLIPRISFNRKFSPEAMATTQYSKRPNASKCKAVLTSQRNASAAGEPIPNSYFGKPMTKRMLKEAPRKIKDLYKAGALIPPKSGPRGK